ncbi:hypothetical protein BU16DRAFT_590263 [Lophium mytilinum]|uniref:Uncharacterized protein n=1 Tax=Lophium mytilinum TaxID=390894 RepID=A0A6A6QRH0_9PEZI|nr:hypothetical protein BU16DRAFT_590263 [Lophium mytilinum]
MAPFPSKATSPLSGSRSEVSAGSGDVASPFIHGWCGAKFGTANDVRRHHFGIGCTGGGCWVKNGSPPDIFWSCWKNGVKEWSDNHNPEARAVLSEADVSHVTACTSIKTKVPYYFHKIHAPNHPPRGTEHLSTESTMSTTSHRGQILPLGINNMASHDGEGGSVSNRNGDDHNSDGNNNSTDSMSGYGPGPYYHGLCVKEFASPAAVRHHHFGSGNATGGCWAKNGRPAQRFWNDHESCWRDERKEWSDNNNPEACDPLSVRGPSLTATNATHDPSDSNDHPEATGQAANPDTQSTPVGRAREGAARVFSAFQPGRRSLQRLQLRYESFSQRPLDRYLLLLSRRLQQQFEKGEGEKKTVDEDVVHLLQKKAASDPLVLSHFDTARTDDELIMVLLEVYEIEITTRALSLSMARKAWWETLGLLDTYGEDKEYILGLQLRDEWTRSTLANAAAPTRSQQQQEPPVVHPQQQARPPAPRPESTSLNRERPSPAHTERAPLDFRKQLPSLHQELRSRLHQQQLPHLDQQQRPPYQQHQNQPAQLPARLPGQLPSQLPSVPESDDVVSETHSTDMELDYDTESEPSVTQKRAAEEAPGSDEGLVDQVEALRGLQKAGRGSGGRRFGAMFLDPGSDFEWLR